jgi:hypothetical protein
VSAMTKAREYTAVRARAAQVVAVAILSCSRPPTTSVAETPPPAATATSFATASPVQTSLPSADDAGEDLERVTEWTDPRALAHIARDCKFVPKRSSAPSKIPPPDPMLCFAGWEHRGDRNGTCREAIKTCEHRCEDACDTCTTLCVNSCETCVQSCTQSPCRAACAETTATCRTVCGSKLVACTTNACANGLPCKR